ncbi:Poly (ADP-ribose) polymerase [Branchiostoma belcheri]|nr:Poly (ADP-ribose) polymerase [Branchiostoma belcheri]
MSEKSARGGAARGNRGRGRGRGTRGGAGRNPGGSVAPGAGANPQFTTDQVVAMSGDVPIVKLQQEAKKVSNRQEYQDPGKLAGFLQKHDFFQTRLNKDGVMLVKVKRDVTLCGKYTASTCKEDGCSHFHLCRQYASGQGCSNGLSCRYSHNLKDDHNIVVLQENFLDGLAEAQVLSMITKPEKSKGGSKPAKKPKKDEGTTPTDVPPSTTSKGGSKPAKKPKKDEGTTPTEVPPPMTSKGGSKPAKKPKKMKDEGTPPTDVPQPMTRQEELKCLPRVCHFYTTEGKSCKNGPACTAGLHVCAFYLTGSCSRKPCQLSHNLSDAQPVALLKKSGLMGKPGKYIVGLYKEKFEAKKKEKQEKKDQQASPTEDSSKSDPG